MLQFQPPGFACKVMNTSLGSMVYYTQISDPWNIVKKLPPLLFLHNFGGGASAYEWSKVYPAYAIKYRVIAPDLIGWGESDHPVRDYQIQDYLTTISEFIHQTCDQPVTVIASSLTAGFTIRLAIAEPDLFQSLFLVSPSGFDDFGQGPGSRLPLSVINIPFVDNLIYALGADNEVAVSNFLQSFLLSQPERVTQEIVEAYLSSAQKPNAKFSALASLQGDPYFDLSLYIRQLKILTLFCWGEEAQSTNIKLGRRLASLNKNAIRDFQVIGHSCILAHLEIPEVLIGLYI
jgi:pimeloyl-ACP methyl ester carboxylesterase